MSTSVPSLPATVYPLLPAQVPPSDDERYQAVYLGMPAQPTVIALPARSAWLRVDLKLIKLADSPRLTRNQTNALYDLGAWLIKRNLWTDHQRVTIHDLDCLACHPAELVVSKGLAFIDVYGPKAYQDTPRSRWEKAKLESSGGRSVVRGLLREARRGPLVWGY